MQIKTVSETREIFPLNVRKRLQKIDHRLINAFTCNFIHIFNPHPGSWTSEYQFHPDPNSYVLEKIRSHDITFLGKTHRRQSILDLISSLIPELHKAGVTHILLEIGSDQQNKLDHFLQTGEGFLNIDLWPVLGISISFEHNSRSTGI
jgi:hypothetical protein